MSENLGWPPPHVAILRRYTDLSEGEKKLQEANQLPEGRKALTDEHIHRVLGRTWRVIILGYSTDVRDAVDREIRTFDKILKHLDGLNSAISELPSDFDESPIHKSLKLLDEYLREDAEYINSRRKAWPKNSKNAGADYAAIGVGRVFQAAGLSLGVGGERTPGVSSTPFGRAVQEVVVAYNLPPSSYLKASRKARRELLKFDL